MEQSPGHSLDHSVVLQMNAHASVYDLSGMVDGTLPPERRASVEGHLAVCAECRAELVSAAAIVESAPRPRARRTKWTGTGLLAAAAVLAILIVPRATRRRAESPTSDLARRGPATRGIANLEPASRANVDRGSIRFTWRPETGASYRLFVTDSVGIPVFTTPTTDTMVVAPASLRLVPGARYLWYVEALRVDGSTTLTTPSSVSIRGR